MQIYKYIVCIVSSTHMAALSRGYKPINIITDKVITLITKALLATLKTRQSKLRKDFWNCYWGLGKN